MGKHFNGVLLKGKKNTGVENNSNCMYLMSIMPQWVHYNIDHINNVDSYLSAGGNIICRCTANVTLNAMHCCPFLQCL